MIGIKSVSFERNGKSFIIYIRDKSIILYKDFLREIDNQVVFEYLKSLFRIIDSWQEEYIDTKIIDGQIWHLSIEYVDHSIKEYYGKGDYPSNFEAFERLQQKLINEVQYE